MNSLRKATLALLVTFSLAGAGYSTAAVISDPPTTGTNVSCASATATIPTRTGSDANLSYQESGTSTEASHCETATYTIPTTTVPGPTTTETGPTTTVTGPTTTVTQTVTATPTSTTTSTTSATTCPVAQPQTTWGPIKQTGPQMTDAQAAACVQHVPESSTTTANASYNNYVPTAAQEQAFQSALTGDEHLPLTKSVDGLDGLTNPSSDDLLQWASYKWGIPTDIMRAEAVQESHWRQVDPGDLITLRNASDYTLYPSQARLSGATCSSSCRVGRSNGILQVSWTAPGEPGSSYQGVNPLYQQSTAFNVDYYAMDIRYFYDGLCSWCGPNYSAGQAWPSIGAWYEPNPWNNSSAQSYETSVQTHLANRDWPSTG